MNQKKTWDKKYKENFSWKKETPDLPKLLKNKSVLELGVGNGKTLISILKQSPKSVTAIDFSKKAIDICKSKFKDERINFLAKDFFMYKTKNKFDIIICYYFLNNFLKKERKKAIDIISGLLSSNGIVIFEDFAEEDFRQKGKIIEKNTIKNKSGVICHFFKDFELKSLFSEFQIKKVKTRVYSPIKNNKILKRKIIYAIIRK